MVSYWTGILSLKNPPRNHQKRIKSMERTRTWGIYKIEIDMQLPKIRVLEGVKICTEQRKYLKELGLNRSKY